MTYGKLLAAIEVCPEEWSNRLIITELFVCEEIRGQGYGKRLIDLAKKITIQKKYRVLMLETQSSNENAVDFYLHEGFSLIGVDIWFRVISHQRQSSKKPSPIASSTSPTTKKAWGSCFFTISLI